MKRHAIESKKIGESKTSPGFYKYEITIQESDGSTKKVPAYGKDMQDAISRLVWIEKITNIYSNKRLSYGLILAWLFTVIVPAIVSSITTSPVWILLGILIAITGGIAIIKLEKYLNKY